MSTQYRPRVSDPEFFTKDRIRRLTAEVHAKIESCAPTQVDAMTEEDTLNWMYRVWRPHASYAYMEMMTVRIMISEVLRNYQVFAQNQHAVQHHGTPRIDVDPQSTVKACYKYSQSDIASRPEISFD